MMKTLSAESKPIQQIAGVLVVMLLMLAQTRLWPSVIGRLGENVGDSVFVLTFPLLGIVSLGLLLINRSKGEKIFVPLLGLYFLCWILITAMWSLNPGLTVDASINALGVFAVGVMAGILLSFRNFLLAIVYSSLIGLIASLLLLWVQPSVVLQFPSQGIAGGVSGIYLHKNYFGLVMAITALCSYLLPQARRPFRYSLVFIFAGATLLSNASNAIGGMILGFVVILSYQLINLLAPVMKKAFIFSGLALIAGISLGYLLFPTAYFAMIGRNPDFTGRTKIWESSWTWAEKQFFAGYGWGTDNIWFMSTEISQNVSRNSGFSVSHSHNSFIELILEAGIIGAVIMLALIVSSVLFSIIQLKKISNNDSWVEPIAVISLIGALLVMGFFEVPLVQERGMFLLFALAVIAGKFTIAEGKTNKLILHF